MNRHDSEHLTPNEPVDALRSAFHSFVDAGLEALASWLKQVSVASTTAAVVERDVLAEAAALLAVERDASPEEVRAAFRAKVKAAIAGGDFHDQAGEVTDDRARRLIDAKNLLLDACRREAEVVS